MHRVTVVDNIRRLVKRRETIRYLTTSNLRAGHRDKVLGTLWYLLDPLLFMFVYYFVFGVLMKAAGRGGRTPEFMLYILIAILVWRFISATINQGANCIRGSRGLIHEIYFPKAVFPISITFARIHDFLWGLGAYVIISTVILRHPPSWQFLWVPLLLLVLLIFVMGMTFITAVLGVFFADTSNVLDAILRLFFYCSPIFYYVRIKPEMPEGTHIFMENHPDYLRVYMFNPVACFYECFRDALLWGDVPDPGMLGYVTVFALVTWIVGFALFTRVEGSFAKYI